MMQEVYWEMFGREKFNQNLLALLTEITHRLIALEEAVKVVKE
jgi:hypothetical protein